MPWPFVESELDNLNLVAWAIPPAVVAAFLHLPAPLDGGLLLLGVIVSGLLMARRRRIWLHRLLAMAWCAIPLGFPYVEARVFEARVRASLAEFDIAARQLMRGDLGPCWGPIRSSADCQVERLPPTVRNMMTNVQAEKHSVRFSFKDGSRRGLLYDPRKPARQLGPYHPIAPGWFLCVG